MKTRQYAKHLKCGFIITVALIITGCGTGYRIYRENGVETLYHLDGNGSKRTIYVVNNDGSVTVHDENDPLIQRFFTDQRIDGSATDSYGTLRTEKKVHDKRLKTQRLIKVGRIQAAKKRGLSDPIYVAMHDTVLGPMISKHSGSVEKTKERFRQFVTEEMGGDRIIHLTSKLADVEVYFRSYIKETAAINIETHKLVKIKAIHFEAYVQSNYLPDDYASIKGLGHWTKKQEVIKRTVGRVTKFIKERIGPNIPKDRESYLSPNSPDV